MNREIKFRGLVPNGRKWVCGYYRIDSKGRSCINTGDREFFIDPKTLGQLVGIKDKNGKDIYEGDIVKGEIVYIIEDEHGTRPATLLPTMGEVVYYSEGAAFGLKNDAGITLFHNHMISTFEVIGNIHQHPHLLTS